MPTNAKNFLPVLTVLLLATCPQANAQNTPAAPQPPTPVQPAALNLNSFAAANNSLLHRVARTRSQAEARVSSFKATQGSFGGLHHKVRSYAGTPKGMVNAVGVQTSSGVVKEQTIKQRYGIELEKVVYHDAKGRKVLTERYEGHQLTRLELFEYNESFNAPVSSGLLVRGDYLRYIFSSVSLVYKGGQQTSYFFRPRPAGE
ncbi:hypothetical protein [Hymenobacter siberiensis]|jgi:hypothetical protein|uniref:hypothetical protein n=2 Tax=Hymenobacter siberiensis TaxID=2848396 RepID=UPI001C1DE954|nr:hypothetical protein [Hymenobacter siberiensis]